MSNMEQQPKRGPEVFAGSLLVTTHIPSWFAPWLQLRLDPRLSIHVFVKGFNALRLTLGLITKSKLASEAMFRNKTPCIDRLKPTLVSLIIIKLKDPFHAKNNNNCPILEFTALHMLHAPLQVCYISTFVKYAAVLITSGTLPGFTHPSSTKKILSSQVHVCASILGK